MRAIATLLVVVFGWSVSLAFLSPCSVHDDRGHDDADGVRTRSASDGERGDGCCPKKPIEASGGEDGDPDDAPGSCPVDCGDCCEGAGLVALPPEVPIAPRVFAELTEIPDVPHAESRAEREPRGIFHVPRAA